MLNLHEYFFYKLRTKKTQNFFYRKYTRQGEVTVVSVVYFDVDQIRKVLLLGVFSSFFLIKLFLNM